MDDDGRVIVKVNLELDTTSSLKRKLDLIRAFALGASVGTSCLILAAAICNHFGWL